MARNHTLIWFSLALVVAVGCGDNLAGPDAAEVADAAPLPDADLTPDAEPPPDADLSPDASDVNDGIADARAQADGATDIQITGVIVTNLKPAVGGDPAGFYVQRVQTGPALFIAVDPTTLSPAPAVGDEVDFRVLAMGTAGGLRQAEMIGDFVVNASGFDVTALLQDVNDEPTLVSNLNDFESELITMRATVVGNPAFAGGGHTKLAASTSAVDGTVQALAVRLPDTAQALLAIEAACVFTIDAMPVWRFNDEAQINFYGLSDLSNAMCPNPTVVNAVSVSPTEVQIELSRGVDPTTVAGDASALFNFDNGLAAVNAVASGRFITVTTTDQTGGLTYNVSVDPTVLDVFGGGVDGAANSSSFTGFQTPAVVRINELSGSEGGGCDLVELRVISGGTMEGFQVMERTSSILTFGPLTVSTNDFVVVHFNQGSATCNPGGATSEVTATNEQPAASFGRNFDTAYDWYSADSGMTGTDNVITVLDAVGAIQDAVLVSDGAAGTAAAASETQAATVAAAGQWQMVGGGIPAGGFVDDDFNLHAVQDLGSSNLTNSIQRIDNGDDNDRDDWTTANQAATYGALNVGQSPL